MIAQKFSKADKYYANQIIDEFAHFTPQDAAEFVPFFNARAAKLAEKRGTLATRQMSLISAIEFIIATERDGNWFSPFATDITRSQTDKLARYGEKAFPLSDRQIECLIEAAMHAAGRY